MAWALVVFACIFLAIKLRGFRYALAAIIVLPIKFRGFRYALAAIIVLLSLTIALCISRQHENEENSKHLVQPDQLAFTEMRLGPSDYGPYILTGRVQNNSQYTVLDIAAKIRILDCDAQEHCNVVGEETAFDMVPVLPSGQVRDIDSDVFFESDTQIHGKFKWNYEITEIRARP